MSGYHPSLVIVVWLPFAANGREYWLPIGPAMTLPPPTLLDDPSQMLPGSVCALWEYGIESILLLCRQRYHKVREGSFHPPKRLQCVKLRSQQCASLWQVDRAVPPHVKWPNATFLVVGDHGPAMGKREGGLLFNMVLWQCFPILVTARHGDRWLSASHSASGQHLLHTWNLPYAVPLQSVHLEDAEGGIGFGIPHSGGLLCWWGRWWWYSEAALPVKQVL